MTNKQGQTQAQRRSHYTPHQQYVNDFAAAIFGVKPRFEKTYCSQCGCETGPGDSGFSDCRDHWARDERAALVEQVNWLDKTGATL